MVAGEAGERLDLAPREWRTLGVGPIERCGQRRPATRATLPQVIQRHQMRSRHAGNPHGVRERRGTGQKDVCALRDPIPPGALPEDPLGLPDTDGESSLELTVGLSTLELPTAVGGGLVQNRPGDEEFFLLVLERRRGELGE